MLSSVLITLTELVNGGTALDSAVAAGFSAFASGCTAVENGRSWFWITGVVSWNSGREALRAGASARANG